MRALYSLIARARTVWAMLQAMVTFVLAGPAALTPGQLLVFGCGVCIIIRMLVPSPAVGSSRTLLLDRACSVMAATAVVGVAVTDAVGSCVFLSRLTLGV